MRLFPRLRQLVPGLPDPTVIQDAEATQFRLFDAYTTFIRNASARTPLLLVADDLH